MRTSWTRPLLVPALACLLLSAPPPPAPAEDEGDGEKGFSLQIDPIDLGVLAADADTNSSKFEEYRDRSTGIVLPLLRLSGESADGNRWLSIDATDVRRSDARYTLNYGFSGSYGLTVDHNIIPHRFGNDAVFLWNQTAPGVYSLPDPQQMATQSAIEAQFAKSKPGVNFAFLNKLITPYLDSAGMIDLKLERKRTGVHLDIARMSNFSIGLDVKHEARDGSRPYGGSFGFSNITEVPEPIDYNTTRAEVSGEWRGKRAGLRFGYAYSKFKNEIDTLVYDNPFRATDATDASAYSSPGAGSIGGAARALNLLPPDNNANLFFASGRATIGKRGWANASFSHNSMSQDDPLVAYSTNRAIGVKAGAPFDVTDAANLPVSNADAKVHALNLNAGIGARFGKGGDIKATYRLYDYDNKTSRITFPGYVRFEAVWEDIGRITVPYNYSKENFGAEIGWTFNHKTRLGFGYHRENYDRTHREISTSHEDGLRVSLDSHADWVQFRASFTHGNRSIGDYATEAQELSFTHPEGINNIPSLRKFDEAARKFNNARALAIFSTKGGVDVSVGFDTRKDNYDESQHGLLSDRTWQLNGEVSYAPKDGVSLFVFANHADRESFQRARQSGGTLSRNAADDWELTLTEKTDTLGAGLDATLATSLTTHLGVQWNRADGDTSFFSPPGGTPDRATGFPEYDDNEFLSVQAQLRYAFNDRVSLAVGYTREDYTADRFARDGLGSYNPSSLILNPSDGDFTADIFAASLRFRVN